MNKLMPVLFAAIGFSVISSSYAGTELEDIIRDTAPTKIKGMRNIVVFQFNTVNALPQLDDNGKQSDYPIENGWLVVINKASDVLDDSFGGDHQIHPRIYATADQGCQNNPNAVVADGTKMVWSALTPTAAIANLKGKSIFPAVIFNANYFDVRAQKNGTTWQANGCSLPLGVFFDNHDGAYKNNTVKDNPYLAGSASYIQGDGKLNALQTFIIADGVIDDGFGRRPGNVNFEIIENTDVNGKQATDYLKKYTSPTANNNQKLIALSGVELLPKFYAGLDTSHSPDSGDSATTRIGIAYNKARDQLYIFEGGAYKNGVTRQNLRYFFKALGADIAMELDGGGSAAIGVNKDLVSWKGASFGAPEKSGCNVAGYVCTPVTQPSGSARAVPSWAYINVDRNSVTLE